MLFGQEAHVLFLFWFLPILSQVALFQTQLKKTYSPTGGT